MIASIAQGLLIPFAGTSLGSACVFFLRKTLNKQIQRALTGFAAGVMVAASIWSLLLPAIEQSESMGKLSFIPAVVGFWIGIFFLLFLDHVTPHLHLNSKESEGPKKNLSRTTKMLLAVTIHNIPEGMAVGVVYAGWISGDSNITLMRMAFLFAHVSRMLLAVQNFQREQKELQLFQCHFLPLRRGYEPPKVIFNGCAVRCRMDKWQVYKYQPFQNYSFFITRHCDSKFPRRSNYFNAA